MAAIFFGLAASSGAILVLCHGLLGTGSWFTAGFFALSTFGLFAFSRWRDYRPIFSDGLFAIFIGCAAASFSFNGQTADARETALLILSLAAYPAARLFADGSIRLPFIRVTSLVVGLGVIVTLLALVAQWNSPHGKPMVFGEFDAAPIQFLTSLGLLIIAAVCTKLTLRRAIILSSLIFLPVVIFAASQVRFTFIAIICGLAAAAILAAPKERKYVGVIMLATMFAVGAGLWARSGTSLKFFHYEMAERPIVLASAGDEFLIPVNRNGLAGCPEVDGDNSIAIRKQIYRQAYDSLPVAGPLGTGLDSFMKKSCIPDAEVHNSLLQATIELGWLAGAAFASLIVIAGTSLLPTARTNFEARFAFCSLLYIVLLSMAHGRVSRDTLLFLFIGYAASVYGRLKVPSAAPAFHTAPAG